MRELVTFGKLSNNVDTTGTGSLRVVASRVAIPYGWLSSVVLGRNMNVNFLHGKAFGSGATN
jgi:hypothetical protein